jgi:predicted nucleic acid-binding Zn ribbon protein
MQKFSDEPLKVHEDCGGEVRQLISSPAIQFKGSGWYVTDYARGGNGSSKSESEKKSSKESGGGTEAKSGTETKSTESKASTPDKSKSD